MATIVDKMYLFSAPHFFDFTKDESEAKSTTESSSLVEGGSLEKRGWIRRQWWGKFIGNVDLLFGLI
ncbi:hypothetical protein D8674_012922 [Pyrus ussuriensis x Pyrus communis]|uniref:Uncharacterized protein n=1 Tax=Pyrus ussuriensis x Pyrus communis TaxID=2448454 RepID=A0A5N5GQQ0_9ROSA|nr:hypothetical protein D8674_012922 [Pyrus ussuriensis x Pyrus communis]